MSRRFWVGLALALPAVVLEMGGHLVEATAGSIPRFQNGSSLVSLRPSSCGPVGRSSFADAVPRHPPI